MSNVILNSNANSALVNTMNASSSVFNPNVYSTQRIIPAHSMTYSKHQPSNGSNPVASQTTNFQINKYGIVSQVLLSFTKRVVIGTANVTNGKILAGDIFKVIEKVELLSSSRVVSTLTRFDLESQFSDLPQDKRFPLEKSALQQRTFVTPAVPGTYDEEYTLPLVFGFMKNINTQLNASFLETLSIRCTWGKELDDFSGVLAATATVATTVINPTLQIRYKVFPEDANAKIIAENFDKPTLNMLSTKYYNENRESKNITVTAAGVAGTPQASTDIKVELKSTECVQCFYVVLTKTEDENSTTTAPGPNQSFVPQPIDKIKFTGSGAEILELTANELEYMKLSPDGYSWGQSPTASGAGLQYIYKIQTGVYDSYEMPNCFSLREINAPQIEVTFRPQPTGYTANNLVQYSVNVVEDCSAIYSISSATGALNNALSN
jgi:hypothetical protein